MDYEPVAVALKFGFIALLYLFLLWVMRSALRDLRSTASTVVSGPAYGAPPDSAPAEDDTAFLVVLAGGGLKQGERFDLIGGVLIGRSSDADIRVNDRYASQQHARIFSQRGVHYVEDLKSTNGTLLNEEPLHGDAELRAGDVIRIGDTEFRYEG
jgi:FHA domain-containing protein